MLAPGYEKIVYIYIYIYIYIWYVYIHGVEGRG